MRRVISFAALYVALGLACDSGSADEAPGRTTTADAGSVPSQPTSADASLVDAQAVATVDAADAAHPKGPPPSTLPVSYSRPDDGTPLTAAELQTATDELIAILRDTRYFAFVDERVHGWPETDPNHGYWWGAFWTGITVTKNAAGTVTYAHGNTGSDNAGIHTAPYLESSCYAHLLWGQPETAHLVRRIGRGFSAWMLAMERFVGDSTPRILSRTFYPPSFTSTEGGRSLFVDTTASRPGINGEPSDYIHLATNPTSGDIYVKNKRSKDDIGHMLRAIAQSQFCATRFDAAGQADMAQLQTLYEAWTADVDGRGFKIPTRDAAGNVYEPSLQLAYYERTANIECVGPMAIRLFHDNAPGDLDCGSGLSTLESLTWSALQPDVLQIVRTHHAAATLLALEKSPATLGLALLQGLGDRVALDYLFAASATPPANYDVQDAAGFMAYAAAVGVPLKSKEVRFVHERLHQAYVGMRDPAHAATYNLFDASVPAGTYSYDPPNVGFYHFDLGLLLGACASPYRNPQGRPVLDCQRLIDAFGN